MILSKMHGFFPAELIWTSTGMVMNNSSKGVMHYAVQEVNGPHYKTERIEYTGCIKLMDALNRVFMGSNLANKQHWADKELENYKGQVVDVDDDYWNVNVHDQPDKHLIFKLDPPK